MWEHFKMSSTTKNIRFLHFCFYPYEIGEWDGEEEYAAKQLNNMLATMDMILPEHVSISLCAAMRAKIWDDWGSKTKILNITQNEIMSYSLATLKTYFDHNELHHAA